MHSRMGLSKSYLLSRGSLAIGGWHFPAPWCTNGV